MNKSVDDLHNQLRSDNPNDRKIALLLIGKMRLYELADDVIAMMEDDEAEVRGMAAWAIDLMGCPTAVPALVEAMYDPAFGVRSNAGWALVHLGKRIMPQFVVPEVIEVLRDDSNADARQMAYLVLYRIGGAQAQDAIQRYWH